ncbi:PAS domain S-box protein [Geomesophilobacter sediminis]|uniref:histidine kinase n=1 Tax=Geomesophilobacter sediminis TaxID=2798584 RepID=A0A8J7JES3_9BACT|nr:PAS domain S-box protein [Geomesophilobacter sediminis]MBJ6725811.1 PAS domain S-box protein [Geomesophilobacter sediminis]
MPQRPTHLKNSVQTLILMLVMVFFTELAVSRAFDNAFRLHPIPGMVIDAGALTLTIAIPLSFLLLYPVRQDRQLFHRTLVLLLQGLSGVYLAEGISMLVTAAVMPKATTEIADVADACLTTLLSAPSLWWLFTRRRKLERGRFLPDLLQVPLTLFVLLLVMIFLADLLQELTMAHRFADLPSLSARLIDAFLTTTVISPLLWLFVIRPLLRKGRADCVRATVVLEQVNEGIISIGTDGAIRHCNPAAERIFGYQRDELVDTHLSFLFPEAGSVIEAMEGNAVAGGKGAGPQLHEICGRRRDQTAINLDVTISRVVTDEGVEYLLVLRDMSERRVMEQELRMSEARFRLIFEHSEDAIIFLDRDSCRIIDVNATAEEMYGYTREELARGGLELVAEGKNLELMHGVICGIDAQRISQLETVTNRRRDGRELVVTVHRRVLELQGTEVVWCTLRDITEQVRLEQEARNIQAGLIQANKMTSLGLLVSGVAHNINNPNGIIVANTQFLARGWDDVLKILRAYREENGDFLIGGIPCSEFEQCSKVLFAGVLDGARRINDTINTLKGFAREQSTEATEVDLNKVANSAVMLLRHVLVRHTENFHLELAESLPRCRGNAQQLGQVVVNLLMNACQALPGRESAIWLSTGYDAERREVTITVKDEGCGITSEVAARMMEPFFTTRLDAGGTGLGLSICRSIVKEHRGELEFSSRPGEGATFVVRLAAVSGAGAGGPEPEPPEDEPALPVKRLAG